MSGTSAGAADVPIDPWTDEVWRGALVGLQPEAARVVRWTEQLLAPRAGGTPLQLSLRTTRMEFDEAGRLHALEVDYNAANEAPTHREYRYQYGQEGRLLRIEQIGQVLPVIERRYDEAGRLLEETEQTGAVLRRTRWRYDAAGREVERSTEIGNEEGSMREVREYRPNGTLARLVRRGTSNERVEIGFDAIGRPVHVQEREASRRQSTEIRYTSPLVAEYHVRGVTAVPDSAGRFERTITLRVRSPEEFQRVGEPRWPVSRRVRDNEHGSYETQMELDARNRPLAERWLDGQGRLVCASQWRWHASGALESIRTRQILLGASCGLANGTIEVSIDTDERGRWVRQAIDAVQPDGQHLRTAVQTREIEDR
jgi:YD repeat-containing protein